ncbi:DUF4040 domain-containing protein [Ahrensia sp. R2A130]|uniref:DUF4040 domain-containing protein n=1 Tax=Ahrensia sp. R2A130 TaxID=744979 RepID=UPI0001E0E0CF|nr:DUF4040 domain-containing protein [Ahrensia sp. R2A130]EFL88935.1 putative monovalent cation/H+ antiporter subunit B [Ahrensia sp. R2A130]
MELALTLLLFTLLVTTAIAIVFMTRLFAVVMLSGVFSLLAALLFIVMDAVDVAFTEAAVGAGISTVLMLSTIALTARSETPTRTSSWTPLAVVVLTGSVLIYGTLDMPNFGDPTAPVISGVAAGYIERTPSEIDVPNIVTAVLASYRSFDTFGEVVVVFTAGIGVVLLLSGLGRRRRRQGGSDR